MTYSYNPLSSLGFDKSIPLDGAGKIPSDYLPSYVDDVVEYDDLASFPGTGETGKIYVAKDTGYTYRWTGSVYVRIGSGGDVALNLGSEGSPSLYFTGDPNTGVYSPGADQVAISTNGIERVELSTSEVVFNDGGENYDFRIEGDTEANLFFVDASTDRVGIGTASPTSLLTLSQNSTTTATVLRFENLEPSDGLTTQTVRLLAAFNYDNGSSTGSAGAITFGKEGTYTSSTSEIDSYLSFSTTLNNAISEKARITSDGKLGIGTTSPAALLHVQDAGVAALIVANTSNSSGVELVATGTTGEGIIRSRFNNSQLLFGTAGASGGSQERARIDSSGRLLVGTSSARSVGSERQVQIEGTDASSASLSITRNTDIAAGGPVFTFARTRGTSVGANTLVGSGDSLGYIVFAGANGTDTNSYGAWITAEVDGTPGADDMPGRLVFSTTSDGASSPTERMRIGNAGDVLIGTTAVITQSTSTGDGIRFIQSGQQITIADAAPAMFIGRNTDDGDLVDFRQAGTKEGSISVSGSTVSYNGAHLSRWSQLPSGAERTEILRGTVLSNIDEMCEWGDEDNEQLNRMKVSDVDGDKNVSGVFQAWDDDDDIYTNDFYCAMTGDFIIRIAQGVTVQRGDLLMSAGDGTAKPQDDDIIRSKTVAKVTSTNVSFTYDDGSYCVPCVLMAC